ncbi:hypothetical protein CP532_6968, partial [Ophiocordyceps camponoti-leonardi (nom. inval.)]
APVGDHHSEASARNCNRYSEDPLSCVVFPCAWSAPAAFPIHLRLNLDSHPRRQSLSHTHNSLVRAHAQASPGSENLGPGGRSSHAAATQQPGDSRPPYTPQHLGEGRNFSKGPFLALA